VHTPEFKFEHDLANVRWAVDARRIDYPVAIDNDFRVWRSFHNHYWPALYFADAEGQIRHHRFGEGDYERSEMVIRQLLAEAGVEDLRPGLATARQNGDEVSADWEDLGSPESYLGYDQATGFDAGGGHAVWDQPHSYSASAHLRLNHWGLTGNWTVRSDASALNGSSGWVAYQFHARDVNLVMGRARKGTTVRFRVLLDGESGREAHGVDVDADGNGTLVQQRMYQLIRQPKPIRDRRFAIEFLDDAPKPSASRLGSDHLICVCSACTTPAGRRPPQRAGRTRSPRARWPGHPNRVRGAVLHLAANIDRTRTVVLFGTDRTKRRQRTRRPAAAPCTSTVRFASACSASI
jgi:hypothetical protein